MFNRTEQRDYLTACRVIAAFFEDRELDMDAWIFGTAWDDEIQRLFTYSELEIPRDRGAL